MSHPFGELLRQYRRRRPGLSQERLAHQIGYDEAVLVRMSQGKKDLTGPSGRDRVVKLIGALKDDGVLRTLDEANALLASANQPPLYDRLPMEQTLILALRPAAARTATTRFSLPAPVSSLTGRETGLADIARVLKTARLVTLTGAGGSGKTRLALEAAAECIKAPSEFANGACFVSLASVRQAGNVVPAIAGALDVYDLGDRPLIQTIEHFLASRSVLLVLDNFEHVLDEAPLVSRLLMAAPMVKVIATSREPLRINGEHVIPVEPLALSSAVELFEERAQAVKPMFAIGGVERDVAEICRRVDCLPLAVELAAARVRQFPPRALLENLAGLGVLDVLTNAPRDAPARHRTLRDTIAWSYALLDADEQLLLRSLGVFISGAEQEQIGAVLTGSAVEPERLAERLHSLTDKNLARRVEQADGTSRFALLELIREFALAKLRDHGELAEAQRHHAAAFAALAEQSSLPIRGHGQLYWFNRLERDYPNFRSALAWSFGPSSSILAGCRLVGSLAHFWFVATKYLTEIHDWTNRALAARSEELPPSVLGDVCACLIINGHLWSRAEWIAPSRQALASYGRTQNKPGIALGLYGLAAGLLGLNPDDEEGRRVSQECLSAARDIGDKWIEGHILHVLAANALDKSDLPLAERRYRDMLDIRRDLGNTVEVSIGLWQLAEVLTQTLRFEEAVACLRESALLAHQIDSPQDFFHADSAMGENLRLMGDFIGAISVLEECIALAHDQLPTEDVIYPLICLGKTFVRVANHARAQALLREAVKTKRSISAPTGSIYYDYYEALDAFAMLAAAAGNESGSARLWGASDKFWAMNTTPRRAHCEWEYAPYVAKARATLGDTAWEAAVVEGRAMSLDQALDYALGEAGEGRPPEQARVG